MRVLELKTFQKKLKSLLARKTQKINLFRIQAYDSIMCEYYCIGFIDFMFKGKSLTYFTNLSQNNFKKNDDISW